MDIRFKEVPFRFDGQDWTLRCNMNVLMDVQEQNGGSFDEVVKAKNLSRSVLQLLAAMLNDDAEERGRGVRYTPRQVGRKLPLLAFRQAEQTVTELLLAAVHDADAPEAAEPEGNEKNGKTSEGQDTASPSAGI